MESVIIEKMRAFLRLDLPDRQRQYFTDTIAAAKRVEVVKAADVFDEREIELIRRTVRPVVKVRPNAIRICGVWGISGGRY